MTTSTPAKLAAWSIAKQVRPGDRVRVIAGQLAGLTGVVYSANGANAVFAIGGLKGVYVRMSIAELEEVERSIES
jgi:ribosomal protein L24